MSTAYIGILDQTGYNYALVTENATPDKAYPILNNHYNNLSKIYELLATYKTSAQFKHMKDRLLNNEMRYSIKYFIANQKDKPDYAYVFNTKTQKWYCFDSNKNGFVSFTKLLKYV